MTDSASAKAARLKPFKTGDDPRRHKGGSKTAARAAWSAKFHIALADMRAATYGMFGRIDGVA